MLLLSHKPNGQCLTSRPFINLRAQTYQENVNLPYQGQSYVQIEAGEARKELDNLKISFKLPAFTRS